MNPINATQRKLNYSVLEHVLAFGQKLNLFASPSICLGLSAGVDSITLLYILKWLEVNRKTSKVRAVHINHGTRTNNKKEEEFLTDLCNELDIDLDIYKISMNLKQSNFENLARKKRQEIFFNHLRERESLALAHHIDDSFEWSLMQQLRSSKLESTLGIPVMNGRIIRPLMCLSKDHILKFAKGANLTWIEDESNLDIRYDRNFLRKIIGENFNQRYPKLLKHYVNRSNELAKLFQKSAFKVESNNTFKKVSFRGGIALINLSYKSSFKGCENQIEEFICQLSDETRGSLHKQVSKFIEMAMRGRRGPLTFSGNVKGFASKGCLFLVNEDGEKFLSSLDRDIINSLKKVSIASQITGGILKDNLLYNEDVHFPFLVFGPNSNNQKIKGLREEHPLLPMTTRFCLENRIWFTTLPNILDKSCQSLKFFDLFQNAM